MFLKQCKSGVIDLVSLSFNLDSNFCFIFLYLFHQRLQITAITNCHTLHVLFLLLNRQKLLTKCKIHQKRISKLDQKKKSMTFLLFVTEVIFNSLAWCFYLLFISLGGKFRTYTSLILKHHLVWFPQNLSTKKAWSVFPVFSLQLIARGALSYSCLPI